MAAAWRAPAVAAAAVGVPGRAPVGAISGETTSAVPGEITSAVPGEIVGGHWEGVRHHARRVSTCVPPAGAHGSGCRTGGAGWRQVAMPWRPPGSQPGHSFQANGGKLVV